MNGDERDLNTLYVLTMYRYGDRERHSYVMGVFDTRGQVTKPIQIITKERNEST